MSNQFLPALAAAFACTGVVRADLLAYWNFNTSTGDDYNWTADAGSGSLAVDAAFGGVNTSGGSALNALFGDLAGSALNLKGNANNGLGLNISFSTTGYKDIQVSFATFTNNNGFNNNTLLYSMDGGQNFTEFQIYQPPGAYGAIAFDLTPIAVMNDSGVVMLRMVFDGATNSGGMNRLDNLQINATAVPGAPSLALAAVAGLLARRSRRRRTR